MTIVLRVIKERHNDCKRMRVYSTIRRDAKLPGPSARGRERMKSENKKGAANAAPWKILPILIVAGGGVDAVCFNLLFLHIGKDHLSL
jgi:hypothetical protein